MTAADPRRNVNGVANMRPYQIGTRSCRRFTSTHEFSLR
jgi:hypothetical protein